MNPGDTLIGLDEQRHLWMILILETANGQVAIANLTSHAPEQKRSCDEECVIVRPGEHPYPSRDSCVSYRHASLISLEWLLKGVENRTYTRREPLSERLLERIRRGALDSS